MQLFNFIRLALISSASNTPDADSALVEACKKELPYAITAYEELVRKYEPTVLNTCRYLLSDLEDSEEASQDVFIRVFRHLKKFDQKSTFRTWLYRIVRNCCYTRIKQQGKHNILEREYLLNSDLEVSQSDKDDPMSSKMVEALAKLSPEDREIITLRFISELSLKEISETIEIQLSATKMRLYRSIASLQEIFKH